MKTLQRLALKLADKATKGRNVVLEPMSAQERRYHTPAGREDIYTLVKGRTLPQNYNIL